MCQLHFILAKTSCIQCNDSDVSFVLDQITETTVRGYTCLSTRRIILIPSQPVFAISPKCCVFSREATNMNFIVVILTRPWLELTLTIRPQYFLDRDSFSLPFLFFSSVNFVMSALSLLAGILDNL